MTDQELSRRLNRTLLEASGLTGDKLELYLNTDVSEMRWDRDVIFADRGRSARRICGSSRTSTALLTFHVLVLDMVPFGNK
ncbi:hypothetical protein ACGFIY_25550 [Micromonospora chersina]|uniref:hypothetical protein n=1 Tax=Micromonospora chersina TaxID=47854 RepID=UPI003724C21A